MVLGKASSPKNEDSLPECNPSGSSRCFQVEAAPPVDQASLPLEEPCVRLQRMYNQHSKNIADDEFAAYARAYYERRQEERKARRSCQAAQCSKMFPFLVAGLLIQVLTIAILFMVYILMGRNNQEASSSYDESTATSMSSPYDNNSGGIPPIPLNILQFCNPESISQPFGRVACRDICAPGACCYMSELNPAHCWRDNLKTCHDYRKACAVLNPLQEFNVTLVPATPEKSPAHSTATTVYPNALVLWDQPELLPRAPENLLTTCQAGFLMNDAFRTEETSGATLTCHEVCYSAACCWDSRLTNPADRCWTHPNCWAYAAACSFLSLQPQSDDGGADETPSEAFMTEVPADVTQLCSLPEGATLEQLLACQQVCLPSECCWNSANIEQCDDQAKCDSDIEGCSILNIPLPIVSIRTPSPVTPTTASEGTGNTTETNATASLTNISNTQSTQSYSVETIRGACWNHDNAIQLPGHKTLCEQACQPGSCCYTPGQSCPNYLPSDYCDKYQPCMVIPLGQQQDTASRPERACANRSDLSECVQVCASGTCCYTNDPWKTCITIQPNTICSDYAACEVLYRANTNTHNATTADGSQQARKDESNRRRLRLKDKEQ